MKEFDFGHEVASLGTSLFVLGFAAGPIIWAPASELTGRRWPLTIGTLGFSIFTIADATCKDTQTLMLGRFFAGLFAASPITLVPACLSDLFNATHRGAAIALYTLAMFTGPYTAPFIGGYTVTSYLGWRWALYIPAIVGFFNTLMLVCFARESYAPMVLVEKARLLRRQTGNWAIHATHERLEITIHDLITKTIARPFHLLFTEPLAFLVTIYMSFIYGLAYGLLQAYPIVFEQIHGMQGGNSGLPFIGLIIGQMIATGVIMLLQHSYVAKLKANNYVPVPEWRLPPCIAGGIAFSTGLFWFGWTGYTSSIHWMAPTAASVFIGFGIISIFMQCFNYLLDCYLQFAAAAFAANTIMRSLVGAAFPLFSTQLFNSLGVQWAGTLLGCIAALLVPIPFVFLYWGPTLRQRSRMAPAN
ncbi:MFS transporter [Aspergillus melleus]|uniref:MFS transporter n=1 Tax=Aspergillus melleus TaxID=138277 RepID=UPI001E8E8B12|nr:uncharacterized protein LDX57_007915 [Aspergillus melleus]KAH8430246.1 hypothetical protein LDX57_007915 [Aspergillus melleus]